jgi:hypothetical protein
VILKILTFALLAVVAGCEDAPQARPTILQPVGAPREGEGGLMIGSSPRCNVTIDGVEKGSTPLGIWLPAGPHTVVLTNDEFKIIRTLSVMVIANQTVRKNLALTQ